MNMDIYRIVRWKPGTWGRVALLAGNFTTIIGTIWLHYLLGQHFQIYIFFLLPVIVVSWYIGKKTGSLFSLLSMLGWLATDMSLRQDDAIWAELFPVWAELFNDFIRLGVFLIVALITSSLRSALDREHNMARKDTLTGLANRRSFYEQGEIETDRSRRYSHPFTALFIDLDNFKEVNDTKGHEEGDILLKAVAEILHSRLRATDICGRLGGDEFAVLLPETGKEASATFATELRSRLMDSMEKHGWPVTFSIGVATFNTTPANLNQLLKKADALMYAVKKNGKNAIRQEIY